MLLAFGLSIFSAISGAVANISARRNVREIRARDMVSVNFLLMTLMLLPGMPWLWHAELTPNLFFAHSHCNRIGFSRQHSLFLYI